ncbi:MAG: rod shape-determining protein MreC [Vicinamibacterales bacterium]
MPILDLRRRAGSVFGVLTVVHVLVISTQVTTRRGLPLMEEVAFGAFSEVQRAMSSGLRGLGNAWSGYVALRQVREENSRLRADMGDLQVKLQQQRAQVSRAEGLQALLELRDATFLPTRAASIIGGSTSPEFRAVSIDRGVNDGILADMAVIAPAGVVGRVIAPNARAAKVQLLIDRNAAAGVLVERSRAQGVVVGLGRDRLRLDFVSGSADIVAGDRVLTSGMDGIYPKGFVVGQVESVSREGGTVGAIRVRPAVDFARLEDVLVVMAPPQRDQQREVP